MSPLLPSHVAPKLNRLDARLGRRPRDSARARCSAEHAGGKVRHGPGSATIWMTVALLSAVAVAPVLADDFYWSGQCGSANWFDVCLSGACDPPFNNIAEWANNWGRTACDPDTPAFPEPTDHGYILGADVDLDGSASVSGLTLDAFSSLDVQGASPATTLTLAGTSITNDGTIFVNHDASYYAVLAIQNDLTLDGSGEVVLNYTDDNAQLNTATEATLTQAAGHTIRGFGQLNAAMVNRGSVIADVTDSGNRLHVNPQAPGITNEATFEVAVGCYMEINTANLFTQTDGEMIVEGTLVVNDAPLDLQGGTLKGAGIVDGSVNNAGATVEPGSSAGTLGIVGDYTQGAGGVMRIELGGMAQGSEYDLLNIGGTARLDGEVRIQPIDGFVPLTGQQFTILTATAVNGCFQSVTGLGRYSVTCNPTHVVVTVVAGPGDTDADGDVDVFDVIAVVNAFGSMPGDPNWNPACDFDGNDRVDVFDVITIVNSFGSGT